MHAVHGYVWLCREREATTFWTMDALVLETICNSLRFECTMLSVQKVY